MIDNLTFLQSIPYKLGSTFHESNVDLRPSEGVFEDGRKLYTEAKVMDVYFFGQPFTCIPKLWVNNGIIVSVDFMICKKHFELFYNSINNELPEGRKLTKDPCTGREYYSVLINDRVVEIDVLTKVYFEFRYWLRYEFFGITKPKNN